MARPAVLFVFLMLACVMVLNVKAQPTSNNEKDTCGCATTDDLRWVCGTDGKSYVNKSTLECENICHRATNLKVKFEGKCETGEVQG